LGPLAKQTTGAVRVQAYALLVESVQLFHQFALVAYDARSEVQFQHLRALKLRIGTQDLKIAAIALANNLTVLTCNRRDFGRVPGLALDDWSV
jgi:tRNA(fMet)-specific endonuclease VapC